MMNKTLLATAVAVLFTAPSVSAIELYKDAATDATLGGYLGIRVLNKGSTTKMVNGSSRINFNFSRQLNNGWTAFSTLEWGIEPFGNTEFVYNNDSFIASETSDLFYNRLAYAGLKHDTYGSLSFGKQESSWYNNVVGGTDNAYVWGGAAGGAYGLNGSGNLDGSGRADNAIQYNLSLGRFSLSLQTQVQDNSVSLLTESEEIAHKVVFNNTYGGALSYAITDKLRVAIGGNFGKLDLYDEVDKEFKFARDVNDEIFGGSITWGNFSDKGWYFSANYNRNKHHDSDVKGRLMPKAYGVEAFVSYLFDNGFQPYLAYNGLTSRADYKFGDKLVTDADEQYYIVGAAYLWDPALLAYIEAQFDGGRY
ncbi:MAG: porin, partial [Shewanella sp.]|nr:porin [Shewanella sp.]